MLAVQQFVVLIDSAHPEAEQRVRQALIDLLCDQDWIEDDGGSTMVGLLRGDTPGGVFTSSARLGPRTRRLTTACNTPATLTSRTWCAKNVK